jgi:hypothetical protein
VADEDVRVADESGAGESVAYKPKTTNSSDFMFHYLCLLVESGCWEWRRCRNWAPFATKCLTRATCQREFHIVPQSAALRRFAAVK